MGLKNKLGKIKNFFVDEIDEEPEIRKPIKKESKKEFEKTKKFQPKELDSVDDLFLEDVSEEVDEIKSRSEKKEKEFPFVEFDEDDFATVPKEPEPEMVIEPVRREPKPVPLYQGSKRKEESKKFKPSPIISPIYGLLDEEGNMVKEEKETSGSYLEDYNIDEVRKKAYGRLDDELEDTIKTLKTKTIEEAEKDAKEELSREKVKIVETKLENVDDDDDDMILPNVSFKEIDVDKETNKKSKKKEEKVKKTASDDDDDDDTKEQDLFNLIDTMYNEEGDED